MLLKKLPKMTPTSDLFPSAPSPAAPSLLRVAITGGIGSGKSYVCEKLRAAGYEIFYCDDEAKRIIRTSPAVRAKLTALIGEGLYDSEGKLVKSKLAAWLCRGKAYSRQVDAIVHPAVALAFEQKAAQMQAQLGEGQCETAEGLSIIEAQEKLSGTITIDNLLRLPRKAVLFMECALLFEAGFDRFVHRAVLVHVSRPTQLRRLMQRDNISREKAEEWLALQLSEEEKLRRADAVLPNEEERGEARL